MKKNELFVELTADESATVNGAHHYYPCSWGYPVYYAPGYEYGYGYGSGYGSASSTTQTTNVNVVYND